MLKLSGLQAVSNAALKLSVVEGLVEVWGKFATANAYHIPWFVDLVGSTKVYGVNFNEL